jgi:hypothetical protein
MEINENMEEMLERLLATKNWEELSPQERSLVIQELGSEEQYILMRKIGSTLVSEKPDLSPDPKILKKLQGELRSKHRPGLSRLLEWNVPAYTMVIPILMAIALSYSMNMPQDVQIQSATKIVSDTVYITKSADTVYVDRVVVRYVEKATPGAPAFSAVNSKGEEPISDGVNMKENEELEKLLVSGS